MTLSWYAFCPATLAVPATVTEVVPALPVRNCLAASWGVAGTPVSGAFGALAPVCPAGCPVMCRAVLVELSQAQLWSPLRTRV